MSMDGYTMLLIGLAVLTAYMQGRHDGRTKNPTEAALRQAEAAVKSANQAIEAGNAANAIAAAEAAAFKSPVAIGERFTYLGIEMLCTEHAVRLPMMLPIPGVCAEYVANGQLHSTRFLGAELDALRAEMKREVKA